MFGLLITTYNRPEYLKQCLDSLRKADVPQGAQIVIVDDCSTDTETLQFISDSRYEVISKTENKGICDSLITGFDYLVAKGCAILMNLDSDAVVRNDFIARILELPDNAKIKTGFHCTTKNANGTHRHKVIEQGTTWNKKASVGGINMCFSASDYLSDIRDIILNSQRKRLNWDHQVCLKLGGAVSVQPSVIQHIGFNSSLNHTEQPDVADDFKPLALPNVTLVIADCVDVNRAWEVLKLSSKDIVFGAIKLLSSKQPEQYNPYWQKIPHLNSKDAYSTFIIKELHKYIDTDFMLIVQYDGYVKNAAAWGNDFINYDYIGAPWWYKDGLNVGNGGFSLRSKRLMQLVAEDRTIKQLHPEDHHICRTYRTYLEGKGIKFAPEDVARRFSVEGYNTSDVYTGQFGFHGMKIHGIKKPIIINQRFGLGDILFCVPLVRYWQALGHQVTWPVVDEYLSIQKNFPDIQFVPARKIAIDYSAKREYEYNGAIVRPVCHAELYSPPARNCMRAKYDMYGLDWTMWRRLTWERDSAAENRLFEALGLSDGEPYNFIAVKFGSKSQGQLKIDISCNNGYKNIYLHDLEGFNLLDWAKVIENATYIHAVSSATLYMFEVLQLQAKELHMYTRKPIERNLNYTNYIWTKQYIPHE